MEIFTVYILDFNIEVGLMISLRLIYVSFVELQGFWNSSLDTKISIWQILIRHKNIISAHSNKFVGLSRWLCRATINPLHFAFCTKLNAHNCTQVSRFKYFFIPLTMHLRKSLQNVGRLSKCYIIFFNNDSKYNFEITAKLWKLYDIKWYIVLKLVDILFA